MVSFTEIARAIEANAEKSFSVPSCISKFQSAVPIHRIVTAEDPPKKSVLEDMVLPVLRFPATTTPLLRKAPIPEPKPVKSESKVEVKTEVESVKEVKKKPETKVEANTEVNAKTEPQPDIRPLPTKGRVLDPICIGIEKRDPMYSIASHAVKQSIECEEARELESHLSELYKSESGRSRGWTKVALEEFCVPRAASGGSVSTKQAFDWSILFTDKATSALLDFVCLAKQIRLAVWNEAERCIGIWPAADRSSPDPQPIPLYHVSSVGILLPFKTTVFEPGFEVRSAVSVEHSLEKLTLTELNSLAEQMGVDGPTMKGKKAERVRFLAAERTKQRLRT